MGVCGETIGGVCRVVGVYLVDVGAICGARTSQLAGQNRRAAFHLDYRAHHEAINYISCHLAGRILCTVPVVVECLGGDYAVWRPGFLL